MLEPIERELAKRRQIELAGTRPNTKPDTLSSSELEVSEQGQARDIVAKKVGLSSTTNQIIRQAAARYIERGKNNEAIYFHIESYALMSTLKNVTVDKPANPSIEFDVRMKPEQQKVVELLAKLYNVTAGDYIIQNTVAVTPDYLITSRTLRSKSKREKRLPQVAL